MIKDKEFLKSINRIISELGNDYYFDDDWDADLFAVGIRNKILKNKLAYLSTWKQRKGMFNVDLDEKPKYKRYFTTIHKYESINFNNLITAIP
jgi:hypothetical protein